MRHAKNAPLKALENRGKSDLRGFSVRKCTSLFRILIKPVLPCLYYLCHYRRAEDWLLRSRPQRMERQIAVKEHGAVFLMGIGGGVRETESLMMAERLIMR